MAALRKQIPDHERPFRLPGGHVIPFLAFWASNLIVYWSGWTTDWKLFVAVLIGFVLLGVFHGTGQVKASPSTSRRGACGRALARRPDADLLPRRLRRHRAHRLRHRDPGALRGLRGDLRHRLPFALPTEQVERYIDDAQAEAAAEEAELGAQP